IIKYYHLLELYYNLIINTPIDILEPNDLIGTEGQKYNLLIEEMNIIKNYNILPFDAYNIAVSKLLQINTFVTLDTDYYRIDGINIYTCFSKKSRKCKICNSSHAKKK
ncbi:MAG: hypothetical protein JSV93_00005, partial [Candidatus Omnitrophota bacterium]